MIGTALGVAIGGALGGPFVGALANEVGTEVVFSSIAIVAAALAFLVITLRVPADPQPSGGVMNALRAPRVLVGVWLTAVPAVFFGTLTVLTTLRLDELGVTASGVAAVFLVAAGIEALISPLVGRASDRRGRGVPLRFGLAGILVACVALPVAEAATWPLAVAVVVAAALAGTMWAPAMALLSDGAEEAGVAQGLAFGLVNLAWAGGQVLGSAGGSATADATSDAVAYTILGAVAAVTLFAFTRTRRSALTA
jgi:predicted MFS family arabinose efflux permease